MEVKSKYTVSELASMRGTSERATYNIMKKLKEELKPFKIQEGGRIYYLAEALSIIGIEQKEGKEDKIEKLEAKILMLEQENQMLTFQVGVIMESNETLKKDIKFYKDLLLFETKPVKTKQQNNNNYEFSDNKKKLYDSISDNGVTHGEALKIAEGLGISISSCKRYLKDTNLFEKIDNRYFQSCPLPF